MSQLKNTIPEEFVTPTALPQTPEQAREWQDANRTWWENQPMRYDWKEQVAAPEFSREFYEEIDARFFNTVREFMPWKKVPFDNLIPFDSLGDKDVLEIGVGNGSHAALLARHARTFTGIDLTDYAVESTSKRLKCFGLNGRVVRMDAEHLDFEDNSFDFIWSWGVIHHSSDTPQILREMSRVLRPGGQAVVMIYNRNFWNYTIINGFFHGILRGYFLKTRSLHKINQMH